MKYVCPYMIDLDLDIKHAERIINNSSTEPIEWWKQYRHNLLKLLLKHQLLEFQK